MREKKKLAEITDRTMARLINEAVVMPSTYLETFVDEQNTLQQSGESDASAETAKAFRTLERTLFDDSASQEASREEMEQLWQYLFSDDITGAKNRMWLYKHKLDDRQAFRDTGFIADIRVAGYGDIVEEYGSDVGRRLLWMVADFIIGYMREHHVRFEAARYSNERFLLFVQDTEQGEAEELIGNLQRSMADASFKHGSRLFRLHLEAVTLRYIENEPFASVLEQLEDKRFRSKE